MEQDKIKPCPFCGSRDLSMELYVPDFFPIEYAVWRVECNRCGINGPSIKARQNPDGLVSTNGKHLDNGHEHHHLDKEGKKKATDLWNTRSEK